MIACTLNSIIGLQQTNSKNKNKNETFLVGFGIAITNSFSFLLCKWVILRQIINFCFALQEAILTLQPNGAHLCMIKIWEKKMLYFYILISLGLCLFQDKRISSSEVISVVGQNREQRVKYCNSLSRMKCEWTCENVMSSSY